MSIMPGHCCVQVLEHMCGTSIYGIAIWVLGISQRTDNFYKQTTMTHVNVECVTFIAVSFNCEDCWPRDTR